MDKAGRPPLPQHQPSLATWLNSGTVKGTLFFCAFSLLSFTSFAACIVYLCSVERKMRVYVQRARLTSLPATPAHFSQRENNY